MNTRFLYRWDSDSSQPEIKRLEMRRRIIGWLMDGKGVLLFGGHGMGKSYLIKQLCGDFRGQENVHVVELLPDIQQTALGHLRQLARALEIESDDLNVTVKSVLEEWLARHPEKQLILLYDEVDAYSMEDRRLILNALESVRKQAKLRLGILAAGGLGLILLGVGLGSPFVSRATTEFAPRFTRDELEEFAMPLRLSDDSSLLNVLYTQTGGIPALCSFGLRALLDTESDSRDANHLLRAFEMFDEEHSGFLRSIWTALGEDTTQNAPALVWRKLRSQTEISYKSDLIAKLPKMSASLIHTSLDVLRAAGLVELGRRRGPVPIRLVPSILSLPEPALKTHGTLREQLRADLITALLYIHRWGSTSFIQKKKLMPEAVFQTAISMTLALRGWQNIVHESEQGAGRADIIAEHPDFGDEQIIIEVKIWDRKGYKAIHDQVQKYRVGETRALATATVSITQDLDLDKFRNTCLQDIGDPVEVPAPLIAVERMTDHSDWPELPVDHLLLKLPRG